MQIRDFKTINFGSGLPGRKQPVQWVKMNGWMDGRMGG